jgi:hypothetical protein
MTSALAVRSAHDAEISARGLAHSKTWRTPKAQDCREASWTAVVLYRFLSVTSVSTTEALRHREARQTDRFYLCAFVPLW